MAAHDQREQRADSSRWQGGEAKAARWLGISRITMKAKLVQFGLHPGQDHEPEP